MDAPMPSSSYISQYFVMQLAASHGVKVVLDGQGSDEIMGGYMHSLYRSIADYLRAVNRPIQILPVALKEVRQCPAQPRYVPRRDESCFVLAIKNLVGHHASHGSAKYALCFATVNLVFVRHRETQLHKSMVEEWHARLPER